MYHQLLHRLLVCQGPGAVVGGLNVLIEQGNGRDIIVLAFGPHPHRFGLAEDCLTFLQGFGSRWSGERIPQEADGDSPIPHRTAGVGLQDSMKCFDGFGEPERVEQGHSTVELRLCFCTARGGKVHIAELVSVGSLCVGGDRGGA